MGLFGPNINREYERFQATEKAVLIDVRTRAEYDAGHISGSLNVPLGSIGSIKKTVPNMETPVYLYCQSGARSGMAVRTLKQMGYTKATNMGGVGSFHGALVR